MALPKGVYYKVLAEGDHSGATPTPSNVITAHYTGKTIDGKQFDSSCGDVPLACRLRDLIEGWIIAMQQMHIGDRWEVYIPAELGYGKYWLRLPLSRLGKARTSSTFLSLLHRFPTRYPRRLHPHLRHRTVSHQLKPKTRLCGKPLCLVLFLIPNFTFHVLSGLNYRSGSNYLLQT